MLALPILIALLATQSAPAGEAQPALVANADGSWTITRTIGEEPLPLEAATDGLLFDEDAETAPDAETDAAIERAFEEAIDQARQEERPR